jgi:hypothetical protein
LISSAERFSPSALDCFFPSPYRITEGIAERTVAARERVRAHEVAAAPSLLEAIQVHLKVAELVPDRGPALVGLRR